MGRGILRGAGEDENLKSNFIWPNKVPSIFFQIKTAYEFSMGYNNVASKPHH